MFLGFDYGEELVLGVKFGEDVSWPTVKPTSLPKKYVQKPKGRPERELSEDSTQ